MQLSFQTLIGGTEHTLSGVDLTMPSTRGPARAKLVMDDGTTLALDADDLPALAEILLALSALHHDHLLLLAQLARQRPAEPDDAATISDEDSV